MAHHRGGVDPMITVTLSRSDLDTTLLALRYLQERLGELPQEFMDLLEGGCPDEAEIDDICARLAEESQLTPRQETFTASTPGRLGSPLS